MRSSSSTSFAALVGHQHHSATRHIILPLYGRLAMDILNVCVLLHLAFPMSRPATIPMLDLFLLFYTTWAISLREHSFGTKSRYQDLVTSFLEYFQAVFWILVFKLDHGRSTKMKSCQAWQAVKSKGKKRKSSRVLLYCTVTSPMWCICVPEIYL
jgi:hypothetical protein